MKIRESHWEQQLDNSAECYAAATTSTRHWFDTI